MLQLILILGIFALFVVLMIQRKVTALIGLPIASLLIAIAAQVPAKSILEDVVTGGVLRLHNPILVICLGAALAEIVKRSGMVEVMIKNTAEFAGDRLALISILMMLVIAVLFTVLTGLGAIVMVGTVVLPILLSLGIPKVLAASIFLMGVSIGGILNLFNWSLFIEVLKIPQFEILQFNLTFLPVTVILASTFVAMELSKRGSSSFRLQFTSIQSTVQIPKLAFLTPIVPVGILMVSGFMEYSFPMIPALLIGIVYGVMTAPKTLGPRTKLLAQCLFDGIKGAAPAVALMMGIGMLLKSVSSPQVAEILKPLLEATMPSTKIGYLILFTLMAPLALFRGPLNLYGMGSGLVALMVASAKLPALAIMAALTAVGQIQGIADPTNTANVWTASYLGTDVMKILRKTIWVSWLMALVGLILGALWYVA